MSLSFVEKEKSFHGNNYFILSSITVPNLKKWKLCRSFVGKVEWFLSWNNYLACSDDHKTLVITCFTWKNTTDLSWILYYFFVVSERSRSGPYWCEKTISFIIFWHQSYRHQRSLDSWKKIGLPGCSSKKTFTVEILDVSYFHWKYFSGLPLWFIIMRVTSYVQHLSSTFQLLEPAVLETHILYKAL